MKQAEKALAELDEELLALIKQSLAKQVVSHSSHDGITTGNLYQSVRLRDEILSGFRSYDDDVFAGVPMAGRTFLDLGCNLAEKTRLAVRAGAGHAEGVDCEEFFIRLGELVNVYNRMPGVVLRQDDVTRSGCIEKDFDIIACFSAFVHVERNLQEILARARQLFMLETHALDAGWYDHYVSRISSVMPYWLLYGFGDHGAGQRSSRRGLVAFGRDREELSLVAVNRSEALRTTRPGVHMLDVEHSQRVRCMWGNRTRTRAVFHFIQSHLAASASPSDQQVGEILTAGVAQLSDVLLELDPQDVHFGSDRYWHNFLKGVIHSLDAGETTPRNPYIIFLRELSARGQYDSGMAYELADEDRAVRRIAPRLRAFLSILKSKRIDRGLVIYNPLSLSVLSEHGYVGTPARLNEHVLLQDGSRYHAQFVDGNHRLAALWLSGAKWCPVLPMWTNVFGLSNSDFLLFDDPALQDQHIERIIARTVLLLDPPP